MTNSANFTTQANLLNPDIGYNGYKCTLGLRDGIISVVSELDGYATVSVLLRLALEEYEIFSPATEPNTISETGIFISQLDNSGSLSSGYTHATTDQNYESWLSEGNKIEEVIELPNTAQATINIVPHGNEHETELRGHEYSMWILVEGDTIVMASKVGEHFSLEVIWIKEEYLKFAPMEAYFNIGLRDNNITSIVLGKNLGLISNPRDEDFNTHHPSREQSLLYIPNPSVMLPPIRHLDIIREIMEGRFPGSVVVCANIPSCAMLAANGSIIAKGFVDGSEIRSLGEQDRVVYLQKVAHGTSITFTEDMAEDLGDSSPKELTIPQFNLAHPKEEAATIYYTAEDKKEPLEVEEQKGNYYIASGKGTMNLDAPAESKIPESRKYAGNMAKEKFKRRDYSAIATTRVRRAIDSSRQGNLQSWVNTLSGLCTYAGNALHPLEKHIRNELDKRGIS